MLSGQSLSWQWPLMASPLVAARPRRVGKNRADIGSNDTAALIDQHAPRDRDEAIAAALGASLADSRSAETPLSWGFRVGAGEGNRTLMTSLEGWGSAIELRPRDG